MHAYIHTYVLQCVNKFVLKKKYSKAFFFTIFIECKHIILRILMLKKLLASKITQIFVDGSLRGINEIN